jgi:hypothetical protein
VIDADAYPLVPLDDTLGTRLTSSDYRREFPQRQWLCDGLDSWKLERAQEFTEVGFPSWEAFAAGDWDAALRLYDGLKPALAAAADDGARHRSRFHRVRVVAEPLTPYMVWELYCFLVRVEYSESIRVVQAESVAALEVGGPLPELVALCGQTLYRVMYDERGKPDGAIRFTDPCVVSGYEELIRSLHGRGEDFQSYFDRVVAPLAVPRSAAWTRGPSLQVREDAGEDLGGGLGGLGLKAELLHDFHVAVHVCRLVQVERAGQLLDVNNVL